MKPLHKNILIEPLTREQLGKIVLPDSVEDVWLRGRVIATGPDIMTVEVSATESEPQIKVGDVVIFPPAPPHLGEYPAVNEEGHIIISENMVLAIED